MELLISGYGKAGRKNLVKCDENGKILWYDTIESPSFLCVSGKRMFAVTESDDYAYLHSYVQNGTGYKRVDSVRCAGNGLCHVCYSEKHHMVFGACWGSGHLLYASIDENGRFLKASSLFQENETGDGALISRVHFVHINQAEDTLMVNNVGLDIIYFYEIVNGQLREKDRIYTERGQHPRHSVYNHDESLLYVITELSNEILVYKMPEKQLLQRISTLPDGFSGKSHCSAICLSPDEKTVYGANRYSESLVFFSADQSGLLEKVLQISATGEKPRHMILTKNGRFLIVCYQVSGEVCIIPLDVKGLPSKEATQRFSFASAACAIDCTVE